MSDKNQPSLPEIVEAVLRGVRKESDERDKEMAELSRLTPEAIGAKQFKDGTLIKSERISCIDPETGISYTAIVQKGRVVFLEDEKTPDIKWPHGLQVTRDQYGDPKNPGQWTNQAKMFFFQRIRQPFMKRIIGKPLPATQRVSG